ncbi:hypothetical protein [Empedobacter brevis]|uniref:hypothetical protein n=1 Tax=Empedobacter brevis TaxID=247 RepID=UPI0039B0B040
MKRTLLASLFYIFCISVHAQSTIISGRIIVDDTNEIVHLDDFVIENLTTNARTKSNEKGLFSIRVLPNDILFFKQIGIEERQLKVTETMIRKGFIEVHVNIEVIELAETKIKPLKKNWKENISKDETQSEKINKSLGINNEFKNNVVKAYFASQYLRKLKVPIRYENVVGLIEQYSDKEVQTYKYFLKKKNLDKYDKIIQLKDYFTEYYFENDLKISKGNILDFIHYCFVEFDFESLLKTNNHDKMILIFEEQSPIYLSIINQKRIVHE